MCIVYGCAITALYVVRILFVVCSLAFPPPQITPDKTRMGGRVSQVETEKLLCLIASRYSNNNLGFDDWVGWVGIGFDIKIYVFECLE